MKKLVIISHTEHYVNSNDEVVGWGSTVNEINYLAAFWDEVVHVGCLYTANAPSGTASYTKKNIRFEAIPPYGGKSFLDKIKIFLKIPRILVVVYKNIQGASAVQLRLPTSMGLFLLPLFSFLFPRKYVFWVKYAGNWDTKGAPVSYQLQRWWLQKNCAKCKVTINGFWEKQPKHCLSFENPCLSIEDITKGKEVIGLKKFNTKFTLCFVGRLDAAKGMDVLIEALKKIDLNAIDAIHFVGDSEKRSFFEKQAAFLGSKAVFHGFLPKEGVHHLLALSHFLVLPSKSEGFPKVIAEAACYGTVPIVSSVGSISHYINESNGFVWNGLEALPYDVILKKAFSEPEMLLKNKAENLAMLAEKFTFIAYLEKLQQTILN